MVSFKNQSAPLVKDQDNFDEDYRDLREKVIVKLDQTSVSTADASATYGATEQALLNELKSIINSLIGQ